MARSLTSTIKVQLTGEYTNDSTGAKDILNLNANNTLTNGTAANKAQRLWESTGRTLSASSSETIDLYDLASVDIGAGAGLDSLGQSFALTGIKAIYIRNHADSGGAIAIGNESTTATFNSPFEGSDTSAVTLEAGGIFLITDPSASGMAVADTSNHLLKITDAGSGSTYDICVIGI